MATKAEKRFQVILARVRAGSKTYLRSLSGSWSDLRSVEAADAVISLLARDWQPAEVQGADILETMQLGLKCIIRAMSVAESYEPQLERRIRDLMVTKIAVIVSFMACCIRQLDLEDQDGKRTRRCIVECSEFFMVFMCFHPDLLDAMQKSPAVADFAVLVWTWIDPRTQLPLFMAEENGEEAKKKGCVVNTLFQIYIRGSTVAKMNALDKLSEDGTSHSAADRLVRVGMARAQAIALVCQERTTWSPLVFGRNLKGLMEVLGGYLVFADPTLLLAFRTYPFIQGIMSALTVITDRLGFERTHAAYYFPLHLLQWKLEAWTMIDGINPLVAMCQLMQGGLISVFLDIVLHGTPAKRWNTADNIAFTMHESYCEALASWIAPYQSFPSVNLAMTAAWEKLDKESLSAVEARLGKSIVKAWVTLKAAFLLGQSRFLAHPEPRLCDNVYHAAVSGIKPHLKGNVQETCASCHSVMYCSIACQAMDWRRSHREDCQSLRHVYDGLKLTHKWIHGSTRLFLFASIESVYRLNCALVESKKAAHPEHGNSNLIVTYDFAKVPGYPDDAPAFLTVAEYLHVIDERGGEVRGAYGRNRLEDVIRQLTTRADMRVIEGQFRIGGRYLWVVARICVPKDQTGNERHDLARMVGGFSYLGPKERNGAENAVPQHTGFCQVPNCRCDYGQ